MMNFACLVAFFINRRDLDRQHKTGCCLAALARQWQLFFDRSFQVGS